MDESTAVVGAVSDLHVGSLFGLCPPEGIDRGDGGVYLPNRKQVWTWDRWVELWDEFYGTKPDWPHVVIVNGEFVDSNHHGTTEIATPSDDEMMEAAKLVMKPAMARCDRLLVTRGTEAHSGKAGARDNAIAKVLGAEKNPDDGSYSFHHLFFECCGVRFDVAHHIGGNNVPHTRGNNIRTEISQAIFDAAENSVLPPDILIRGHVHQLADSGENFPIYGVVLPAWQLKTTFGHRITRRRTQYVGGLICELENRQYQKRIRRWRVPLPPILNL